MAVITGPNVLNLIPDSKRTYGNDIYSGQVIGFNRTNGTPIYGRTANPASVWDQKRYVQEQTEKYERERISSQQSSNSFSGIQDPEVIAALKNSLLQLTQRGPSTGSGSGSSSTVIPDITGLLSDYSKQSAFTDASALIKSSLAESMESQKPIIQRAMEGAGTSAGSMQALLSQQLADKAALSAGKLGAEQAKAYGQIAANLMQTQVQAESSQANQENQFATDLARLADALKIQSQSSNGISYFSADQMNPKDGTGGVSGINGGITKYGSNNYWG
jgi:hypothetical protein